MYQDTQLIDKAFKDQIANCHDSEFNNFAQSEWIIHGCNIIVQIQNKLMCERGNGKTSLDIINESIATIIEQMKRNFCEKKKQLEYYYFNPADTISSNNGLHPDSVQRYLEEVRRILASVSDKFNMEISIAAVYEMLWEITQMLSYLKRSQFPRFYFQVWYDPERYTVKVQLFDPFDMIPEESQVHEINVHLRNQSQMRDEIVGRLSIGSHFKGFIKDAESLPKEGNTEGDFYFTESGEGYRYCDGEFYLMDSVQNGSASDKKKDDDDPFEGIPNENENDQPTIRQCTKQNMGKVAKIDYREQLKLLEKIRSQIIGILKTLKNQGVIGVTPYFIRGFLDTPIDRRHLVWILNSMYKKGLLVKDGVTSKTRYRLTPRGEAMDTVEPIPISYLAWFDNMLGYADKGWKAHLYDTLKDIKTWCFRYYEGKKYFREYHCLIYAGLIRADEDNSVNRHDAGFCYTDLGMFVKSEIKKELEVNNEI